MWLGLVIVAVATILSLSPLAIYPDRSPSGASVRRLKVALLQDPRYAGVQVMTTESGRLVLILAAESTPSPERLALGKIVREQLGRDFAVNYGSPFSGQTAVPNP